MIHTPGRRLLCQIPMGGIRRKALGIRGKPLTATLKLTSLIDILISVVVFVLMEFTASGECIPNRRHLPAAENGGDMVDAPLVSVHGSQVMVDGTAAGSTRSIDESGRMANIGELGAVLKSKREIWMLLNGRPDFPGTVILEIDRVHCAS